MKPRKGKAKVKVTASGKKVSYGQAGKAKDGGPRVRPGTKKGDAYCARSAGQMKRSPKAAKNPNSPLRLSRKRWKCKGTKSGRLKKKSKSRVNEAGNYTKPTMRKNLFNKIKAGSRGGRSGQWTARKAQLLASEYKKKGGGYRD